MKAVYNDFSYSHTAVVNWCIKFGKERKSTEGLACHEPARVSAFDKNAIIGENCCTRK